MSLFHFRPDPGLFLHSRGSRELPTHFNHAEQAMQIVLEFPAKVFVQWGAIAQEIVSSLVQRGVGRDEIPVVLERIRTKWEQLDPALPDSTDTSLPDGDRAAELSTQLEGDEMYVSRHWRSQSARMLIEFAMADYQRHIHR